MKTMAMVGAFTLAMVGAAAQSVLPPDVPENLKVPAGEIVLIHAHAKGVQIYSCAAGADGKYAWTLKAPKAELFDEQGKSIGEHFAGPTWRLKDGSEVTGKMVAKHDAPKAGAIPWLLVTVTGHKGSGGLETVTTIHRVNTEGGVVDAAKSCDASKSGIESESSYSADYYFYAPRK
ncbi:MAG TPA: DUF3455 domain-containing protein [Candidatus Sulfotelmatobacter sp.]|jgi:hypothetical protein|nr:DUF3455 domain-containing protein [Candidatus Sulfotelmatobacter sp.]